MTNQVGIIISSGFGARFSTWNEPEMCLDQELANMIFNNVEYTTLKEYCEHKYPDAYLGGLADCRVEWVDEGTLFKINEYDGSESLELKQYDGWLVAQ